MNKSRRLNLAAKTMAFAFAAATVFGTVGMMPQMVYAVDSSIIDQQSTGNLTINKTDADGAPLAGATFSVYKIMSLTPASSAGDYASFAVESEFQDALSGVTPDALNNYDTEAIENLISKLQTAADSAVADDTQTTAAVTGTAEFSGLDLGYYLVVETAAPEGYVNGNPFLVAIPSTDNYNNSGAQGTKWVYNVTVTPKNSKISIEKKLGEDTAGVENDGSVKVGDYVSYVIDTKIPSYPEEYFVNDVTFTIRDVMSDGLKIVNDGTHPVTVKVNDSPVTAGPTTFTVTAAEKTEQEADLTIDFEKNFIKDHGNKSVQVTYYAQVTDKAVMGTSGNPNKVYLDYNNAPGETDIAEGPDVKVYSFGIKVVKFTKDGGNKPLQGAEFELYSDELLSTKIGTATSDSSGNLSFPKLDEGTYYLKETKSPAGYTLLANPIKVEIIANEFDGVATGTFTLKVDGKNINATSGDYVAHLDQATGTAVVAVENHKGFSLPATGGMGIALFLIIGAAGIAVVSVIITKKTKSSL